MQRWNNKINKALVKDVYDYNAKYDELIRDEMHRLYDLEGEVPMCYRSKIHSMVVVMEGILQEIKRNREFDNWNN